MSVRKLLGVMTLLLVVVLTQGCEGMSIGDITAATGRVIITNDSTNQTALARISTMIAHGQYLLAPGQSRTLTLIFDSTYTLEVASPDNTSNYPQHLKELRAILVDFSLGSGVVAPIGEVIDALTTVQQALNQINASGVQACTGKIIDGGTTHATMTYTTPGDLGGVWTLSCK